MTALDAFEETDRALPEMISSLQELIRQPSVSAQGEGLEECAELVRRIMEGAGIRTEILHLDNDAAPLVYGEVNSKSNPDRTLLFYNHYDVQPVEPRDLWDDEPFSGTVRDGKIFGRGAADDKGELITRIKAVEAFLRTRGDVPCNVKFAIEGEEETGSAHISEYLKKFREKLACDGIIWEFGYVDQKNRPIISLGMKGLLYAELTAEESKRDAHSSLAVLIRNPAWRLISAINTMRDDDGRILIKEWYKEVVSPTDEEIRLLHREPFDEHAFKDEFGIKEFVGKKRGRAARIALATEPTCNIAGIISGYTGEGAKTVLPGTATAKIDFRLVPDMDPNKQAARLRRHLKTQGFGDIKVRMYHGEAAWRTSPSERIVGVVREAANEAYGSSILNISNAGTGPMHQFHSALGAPCVAVGSTYVFSRIHSPNEFARIDLLGKTAKCICGVMERFGTDNEED